MKKGRRKRKGPANRGVAPESAVLHRTSQRRQIVSCKFYLPRKGYSRTRRAEPRPDDADECRQEIKTVV